MNTKKPTNVVPIKEPAVVIANEFMPVGVPEKLPPLDLVELEKENATLKQQLQSEKYTNDYLRKQLDRRTTYYQAALLQAAESLKNMENMFTLLRAGGEQ